MTGRLASLFPFQHFLPNLGLGERKRIMSAFFLYSNRDQVDELLPLLTIPYGTTLPAETPDVVIQWGTSYLSTQDPTIHVLNGAEGLTNVSSKKILMNILQLNGIPCIPAKTGKITTLRKYYTVIFQQEELMLFRSKGKRAWLANEVDGNKSEVYEPVDINKTVKEIRRIIKLALRSVYAVGLDFGGVLIGIMPNGKLCVLDVQATPNLNPFLAEKLAKAWDEYIFNFYCKNDRPVMLGADPEFVLRNQVSGEIALASDYLEKRGRVGCDFIWLRGDQTRKQLPLAELRPSPAVDPRQLTINLYKTMLLAQKKINSDEIEWLAGGMPFKGYPIGGHIHFSRTWLNFKFLRALDSYLALPLMLLENEHSRSRRPKYGFFGDFRLQFHGGFEYRTLPSWIISPRVTKGVFAMSKLLAESYWQLNQFPTLSSEVQDAFYQGNKNMIIGIVQEIWPALEQLPKFDQYAKYILPFKQMIFNLEEWNEFQDIRRLWRIYPYANRSN
jgi:hypothetical protein